MSSSARKRLKAMRNSKAGWWPHELLSVYSGFGFTMRHGRGHDVVTHPDFPELRATVPRHPRELAKKYASTAVDLIDKLKQLQKEAKKDAGRAQRKG